MAKYSEWLEESNLNLIKGWARDGLTEKDIAHNMGIAESTFREWKKKFPTLSAALKENKAVADYIVENELYKSTQTRTIKIKEPIKVKVIKKDGQKMITEEKIEYVEKEVVLPAQVTAQIFWLKNRRPDKWRDRPEAIATEIIEDDGLLQALKESAPEKDDDSWMVDEEQNND